jgi:tetratricopeptide (TPR) repeat protein
VDLPIGLRQVFESGDCVLFIGAGIGSHFSKPDGTKAPDAYTLAQQLSSHFSLGTSSTDLAKVAEIVELRKGRPQLDSFVRKALSDLEPDHIFRWLTTFRWRAIFTTNYDRCIERAYDLNPRPAQTYVSMSLTSDLKYTNPAIEVPIFHLHGSLFGEDPSPIVITQKDYARYHEKRQMLWQRLRQEFATSTFLYLGYSNRDPNWRLVLDEVLQEFLPSVPPRSFRLDPHADPMDVEILKASGLETITGDFATFQAAVYGELGDFVPDSDSFTKRQKDVPQDLHPSFKLRPVSILRLLSSWEYVSGVSFNGLPNTDQFLKGDQANWSLLNQGIQFSRDVESEVWDYVMDFATAPNAKSKAAAILAPAGYGTTTTLMSLAVQITKARIGPVFMLRKGAELIEGDVDFAASIFPGVACFFIIDQAREHASSIDTSLFQQRQTKNNCLFLLGERRNEWRMARARFKLDEFEIEALSDVEIDRLLDYLSNQNALGKLAELDRPFQFDIVKKKHEKQLLIAMRESVEGANFDAIIEDEYRGIQDQTEPDRGTARDLYLLVSCFFQHGVDVRQAVLADVMGESVNDLYKKIGESLDGLVLYDEIDPIRGEYGARARHRVIAEVVWKRCGSLSLKEKYLQAAMEKLNLSYKLDKIAFDKFTREEEVVESFSTFEGKTRFFETAAKRDPSNAYTLQHFARMLLREKKPVLGLAQIDAAIKLNPSSRVLYHTRGTVLASLAVTAESEDIGRKWLLQSESEFQRAIAINPSDEYSHASLAQLYLDWARKCESEDESSEYVTKAEAAVSVGLKSVNNRQSLWIVSSAIQEWLGNQPSRIVKLQNAVAESSSNTVARYLLGRAYREHGEPERAKAFLEPIIRSDFGEFRSFVEYVRAMLDLGEPYSKCIAVLSQTRTDGLSDPAYVALLGGLHFLESEGAAAKSVFEESTKGRFTPEEKRRIRFRPLTPSSREPIRLSGKVSAVKPGYVIIQLEDTRSVFSRVVRVEEKFLQRGSEVSFQIAFSANGAIGDKIEMN